MCEQCEASKRAGLSFCEGCAASLEDQHFDESPRATTTSSPRRPAVSAGDLLVGFEKARFGVLIAAIVGALGTFLPWAHAGIFSISGYQGADGYLSLGLFLVPILVATLGQRDASLSRAAGIAAIVFGGFGLLLGGSKLVDMPSRVSPGIGLLLIAAAGIAVVVFSGLSTFRRAS